MQQFIGYCAFPCTISNYVISNNLLYLYSFIQFECAAFYRKRTTTKILQNLN